MTLPTILNLALYLISSTIFECYEKTSIGISHIFYAKQKYFTSRKSRYKKYHNEKFFKKCEGCDSNARIPTKMGPKPIAFDLAGQPSHSKGFL